MIAIQIIDVIWDKAARAAPIARLRNQIPRAFALQEFQGKYEHVQLHKFSQTQERTFLPSPIKLMGLPELPTNKHNLYLKYIDNQLSISFLWSLLKHGLPNRHNKKITYLLNIGETIQIRINGRHASESPFYTQTTYNLAYHRRIESNIFLNQSFTYLVNLEENLF